MDTPTTGGRKKGQKRPRVSAVFENSQEEEEDEPRPVPVRKDPPRVWLPLPTMPLMSTQEMDAGLSDVGFIFGPGPSGVGNIPVAGPSGVGTSPVAGPSGVSNIPVAEDVDPADADKSKKKRKPRELKTPRQRAPRGSGLDLERKAKTDRRAYERKLERKLALKACKMHGLSPSVSKYLDEDPYGKKPKR